MVLYIYFYKEYDTNMKACYLKIHVKIKNKLFSNSVGISPFWVSLYPA